MTIHDALNYTDTAGDTLAPRTTTSTPVTDEHVATNGESARSSTCDGTRERQTRNCPREAVWQLKHPEDLEYVYGACARHFHQVGTYLLDGEQGELCVRRIRAEEA